MTLHNALDGNLDSYNLLRICNVPGIMYFVYHIPHLLNNRFIQLTKFIHCLLCSNAVHGVGAQ